MRWWNNDNGIETKDGPVDLDSAVAGEPERKQLVDDGSADRPVRPAITQHQHATHDRCPRRRVLEVVRHRLTSPGTVTIAELDFYLVTLGLDLLGYCQCHFVAAF